MLSGGLDSLIGTINALEAGRTPLLISHAGEGATSDAQTTIFDALKAQYPANAVQRLRLWMAFPDGFVRGSAGENTTRGRSFRLTSAAVMPLRRIRQFWRFATTTAKDERICPSWPIAIGTAG